MSQIDMNKLRSLSPEDLNDDDINYLFQLFSMFDTRYDIKPSDLKLLFNLALEVLKFKGEEASFYEMENKNLSAALVSKGKNGDVYNDITDTRSITKNIVDEQDLQELRQQLLHCEVQNDQLATELKSCEKELVIERKESEKLIAKITILEKENMELRREITSIREEASEQSALSEGYHETPEVTLQKHQELITAVCQKNKHISQLLNDIEILEKENLTLRKKLTSAQSDISLATKNIIELSGELTSVKCSCQEKEEKLVELEQQNLGLKNQVQEMVTQKMQRDSQLDDFTESIDSRIKEWKSILDSKESEISGLRARLAELQDKSVKSFHDEEYDQIFILSETLQKREEQIDALQQQLTEATKEINDSAALIEKLKQNKSKSRKETVDLSELTKLKAELQLAEDKIQLLEAKLKDAEEDAKVKAEETSDMVVQLREYEAGEFGLAEAVAQLKRARAQARLREEEAQAAVRDANLLHAANRALRKKLRLASGDATSADGAANDDGGAGEDEEALLAELQPADRLQEEAVQLRLQNRQLVQHIKELTTKVNVMSKATDTEADLVQTPATIAPDPAPRYTVAGREPMPRSMDTADPDPGASETKVEPSQDMTDKVALRSSEEQSQNKHWRDASLTTSEAEDTPVPRSAFDAEREDSGGGGDRGDLVVAPAPLPPAREDDDQRLLEFVTENEALRRGMHEILDSIRIQDGCSDVQVQSRCLERLLEALDARHISGWYHPAMRLQAQVTALEGSNTALRDQLRIARLGERNAREECARINSKLQLLQSGSHTSEDCDSHEKVVSYNEAPVPADADPSSAATIHKLNFHLLEVLNENVWLEERNVALEAKWEDMSKRYATLRHEVGLLHLEHAAARAEWRKQVARDMRQLQGAAARALALAAPPPTDRTPTPGPTTSLAAG